MPWDFAMENTKLRNIQVQTEGHRSKDSDAPCSQTLRSFLHCIPNKRDYLNDDRTTKSKDAARSSTNDARGKNMFLKTLFKVVTEKGEQKK